MAFVATQARQLRQLERLALHLEELLFQLLNYIQVVLLLLPRVLHLVLQLRALLFFPCQLPLRHLQVHLQYALFTRHVLVHLMDLVQILL